MSLSRARNSRLVNNTSTMPVQLTKLVMSASVTVRPIVRNWRPTGRSSKYSPSPTVSIAALLAAPPSRHGSIAACRQPPEKTMPRIALIHAVTVAMAPVHDAFRRLWPAADCTDLLDTALAPDRERDGELTAAMTGRIVVLARYAAGTGAAGILYTCSAFGEAIERAAAEAAIPVLKPNEAMFEAALEAGNRIGMLAT